MSLGSIAGAAAMGHKGWVTARCYICGKKLDLTKDTVYYCPKCHSREYKIFYCVADAKRLHYKCPFDGVELKIY